MTNTRISMTEAYDNKDVIQQIYLMKDKIATGTYKSVDVSAGTGADVGKIIFTFTDQNDTQHIFKILDRGISSVGSSQSGSTVTVTVTYNDTTTDTFTFSSVSGAATLDTVQTFTAQKTFQDDVMMADVSMDSLNVSTDIDVGGDGMIQGQLQVGENLAIEDSSDDTVLSGSGLVKVAHNGGTAYAVVDAGSNQTIAGNKTFSGSIIASSNVQAPGIVNSGKTLAVNSSGYVTAPSRAYVDAGSTDVITKQRVSELPVVHLTGNESVSGVKTFTSEGGVVINPASTSYNHLRLKTKGMYTTVRGMRQSNDGLANDDSWYIGTVYAPGSKNYGSVTFYGPRTTIGDTSETQRWVSIGLDVDESTGECHITVSANDSSNATKTKTIATFDGSAWD